MKKDARKVVQESAEAHVEKDIKAFVDIVGHYPSNSERKSWGSPIPVDPQSTPLIEDILLQSEIDTSDLGFDYLYDLVIHYELSYWNALLKEEE